MLEFTNCHGEAVLINIKNIISVVEAQRIGTIISVPEKDHIVNCKYKDVIEMLRCAGIPIYRSNEREKDVVFRNTPDLQDLEADELIEQILPI